MSNNINDRLASLFWDREPPPLESDQAILRIMDIGDWDDICFMEKSISAPRLIDVFNNAPVGALTPQSQRLWQLRLKLKNLPKPTRIPNLEYHALPFRNSS